MKDGCFCFPGGTKHYYLNDQLHRVGGPAIDRVNDTKLWYQYGKLHREDGPACEWSGGHKSWYYKGKHIICYSQEEFERILKLKAFW